ncbi:CHRD domain-containing protein [Polaromonas sp.]|uniref:CHRD domain-containing protein n=1 Tax=Polaromonas sp. TaxID=1869339 RepID=UPI003263AE25
MTTHARYTFRSALVVTAAFVLLAGCKLMPAPQSNLATFTTQMRGANEVPPAASNANGQVDAVLNKDTRLLRWQLSYSGLSGAATAGHFHGPAAIGANAGVALPFTGSVTSPMSGQATLTPAQADDLMAGKWYANIHTAKFPAGEIRGQMTLRP